MRTLSVLFVLMLVALVPPLEAQVVRVETDLFMGKRFLNSAVETVSDIQIAYTGNTYPALRGAYPDSIRLEYYAVGSSVGLDSIKVHFTSAHRTSFGAYVATNALDTIIAQSNGSITLSRANYVSRDFSRIVVTALSAGNALAGSGGNKLWVRYARYFTLPK